MKKKIAFVLNDLDDFNFLSLLKKHLKHVDFSILNYFPSDKNDFDLIVLWNYQKILPVDKTINNVIIFHGSSLPKGKGWAPVYYSFVHKLEYYCLSCIKLAKDVDAGDIVAQAKIQIEPWHTAKEIRDIDSELSIILLSNLLKVGVQNGVNGKKQEGKSTFNARRNPADNEIDINQPFSNLIDHLRGCEDNHPAYFKYNGCRFDINIFPHGSFISELNPIIEIFHNPNIKDS